MTEQHLKMGYLISRYPALSHTFILREVRGLRELGLQIETASINGLDRAATDLTGEEREEAARTFFVKPAGWRGALSAHWRMIFQQPFGYARGLCFALWLGGLDLRQMVLHFCYFIEAAMVGAWLRAQGLRHLHVHFATPATTVGLIAARAFGFTFSMTVHGPDEFYDVTAHRLKEKLAGAAFVTCIGNYARSQLMKLTPATDWHKFEVAPLGVFPAVFQPLPPREARAVFEIICVGRLVDAKGQHILLAAVERLLRAGRNVHLQLVGDGPDRAALAAAVAERGLQHAVSFTGPVNQDGIRALYGEADVFALASFAEGIPVVLMEAMALQLPCVTTRITGIPELIRDGIEGLLVAPSDAHELAEALARLMDDPGLRAQLGAAGRKRVLSNYDLTRNLPRLAEIFRARLTAAHAVDATDQPEAAQRALVAQPLSE